MTVHEADSEGHGTIVIALSFLGMLKNGRKMADERGHM